MLSHSNQPQGVYQQEPGLPTLAFRITLLLHRVVSARQKQWLYFCCKVAGTGSGAGKMWQSGLPLCMGRQQAAVGPVWKEEHSPKAEARMNLDPNLLSLWPARHPGDLYFAGLQWSFPSHKMRINDIFADVHMHKQQSARSALPALN